MKKLLMASSAIVAISTSLYAGAGFEVTPMVGKKLYNYSDDSPRFDDGEILMGVRAAANISEKTAIELGFETSDDNGMGDGGKTDFERYMLHAKQNLTSGSRVTPYVIGGMGYEKLHRDCTTGDCAGNKVSSQAFYSGGAGLKYNVSDKVSLVTEARVIHKVEDSDTDIVGNIGLGYRIGGATVPVQPSAGINQKALSMAELAALAGSKKQEAPVVATVATTEQSVIETPAVLESVDVTDESNIRYEYDTSEVSVCDVTGGKASSADAISVDGPCETEAPVAASGGDLQGIYVQVGAFSEDKYEPLVQKLNSKGFATTFDYTGLTKVLVGPYSTKSEASKALRLIKRYKRDAFIKSY